MLLLHKLAAALLQAACGLDQHYFGVSVMANRIQSVPASQSLPLLDSAIFGKTSKKASASITLTGVNARQFAVVIPGEPEDGTLEALAVHTNGRMVNISEKRGIGGNVTKYSQKWVEVDGKTVAPSIAHLPTETTLTTSNQSANGHTVAAK